MKTMARLTGRINTEENPPRYSLDSKPDGLRDYLNVVAKRSLSLSGTET
jgi:hypothetical protein